MDDVAYVHEVYPGCLQSGKSWEDVELCVKTAVLQRGYAWSFSFGPDGTKVATSAYWEFEKLRGQTLFEAAQRYMSVFRGDI